MRVVVRDVKEWKMLFETLSQFISEAVLRFREEGMETEALDPSMIVYTHVFVPKSAFEVYESDFFPVNVPLPLSDYHKILTRLQMEDSLSMELKGTTLHVVMKNPTITKEYAIHVLDLEDTSPTVSIPEGGVRIRIDPELLRSALKNVGIISKQVVLGVYRDTFFIESVEGSNKARSIISGATVEGSVNVKSTFALEYLLNILKGAEKDVMIYLGEDAPVRIEYQIGPSHVMFVLAPLIL